jgi:hypothetical protein
VSAPGAADRLGQRDADEPRVGHPGDVLRPVRARLLAVVEGRKVVVAEVVDEDLGLEGVDGVREVVPLALGQAGIGADDTGVDDPDRG